MTLFLRNMATFLALIGFWGTRPEATAGR
jgi:hypothetical protein